ncbi:MAG: PHP domain-containing protein [Candidatus Velamenicoccus archaeovorus]
MLTNGQLSVLLADLARDESDHRRRALNRASRAAMLWPVEVTTLVAQGEPLTELPSVGPWVAARIAALLEDPPGEVELEELRRGFLTVAEARTALATEPGWAGALRGDLQMHTTDSDGTLPLEGMVEAASAFGYGYVAITDHSQSLRVARGMDEGRLAAQGEEIDALNASGAPLWILKGIEMDVFEDGSGDMDVEALRRLDLVLGAFHTGLRVPGDRTERYLAALRNPDVHVLAHPTTRMFGRRPSLRADWPRVFAEAERLDKALEIDASPHRQDLSVELLRVARDFDVKLSIGTDAHRAEELRFVELGLAAAALAGIPRERIVNARPVDEVLAWTASLRARAPG